MRKTLGKLCGPKLAFKQKIAVYQGLSLHRSKRGNGCLVELLKWGKFCWDTRCGKRFSF